MGHVRVSRDEPFVGSPRPRRVQVREDRQRVVRVKMRFESCKMGDEHRHTATAGLAGRMDQEVFPEMIGA